MCWTWLWLLAFLAFSSLPYQTVGSPLKVMSAPNLLRVGTVENIFVECQDCSGGDMMVRIIVMNHPTRELRLTSTSVTLTSAQDFQGLGQIKIPAEGFSRDPTVKQYVYLQAHFPDKMLEKVVLVSFLSGYIFIQTDKTLYTPNSRVHYRMFAVTPGMEPVERDETTDASIDIEIINPKGITFPSDTVILRSGVCSGFYHLGEFVTTGVWKVVAKFHSSPQQTFSAEFEVKEYVLPSFEVKLIPLSSFFYVDSPSLTINIQAKYLFGEDVDGAAYVVFGVVHEGRKKSFPDSVQKVEITGGEGEVILKKEHMIQSFNIDSLVGSSIFVAVSVLTENGGEMVEAESRGIQVVTSPYTINLKKTPKYFKPGMSFDVVVEVMNPDKTPAEGVPVVVGPGDVRGLTASNGMARVTVNTMAGVTSLTVTAKTDDPQISPDRQESATMTALPYQTSGNNYIHIGVDTAELQLGRYSKISFNLNTRAENGITYLILSRGQLVKYGRYTTRGQVLISLIVPITKEMLPSFRIIAYYYTNANEVVSDSVWVDVKDTCMGSLKLEPSRLVNSYEPRYMFGLTVIGDPGATVGLVAVDKGVYVLNSKFRLTQKKVWDLVEKYDTGCTPGGGKDSMGVFYDAGLLFESSSGTGTPYRQELRCPLFTRRKRASTAPDWDEEDDISYMDSSEIVSRTQFSESWLWSDITLPACPPSIPNCGFTVLQKLLSLPDSITTWQVLGISLSRTHGICVSSPLEVLSKKEFFIDLKLPQSAVRGEQLEIKAIINNYSRTTITVHVELLENQHLCSAASSSGRYRQKVIIGSSKRRTVPFIIIPLKEGLHQIEVEAYTHDLYLTDGIRKTLKVVPEGKLTKHLIVKTLAPAEQGIAGAQREIINSRISRQHLLPDTPVQTIISVTVREPLSARVEDAITLQPMERMIYQPTGNGEVNMIHMTMTVIATTYLDKTNQWESVGLQKRNEALQHIRTGYQNELAYRKSEGSFSALPNLQSSSWLTAYVAKVFAKAFNLIDIPRNMICDAVKFVILNAQQPDGSFREVGTMVHGGMAGDVRGADSHASMTAFCLIILQETRTLCSNTNGLPASINRGVTYLENCLPSLTSPYAVAMTSYALANEDKLNQRILYKFASQDSSHWPSSVKHVFTLEATAYALLALVKVKAFEDARPIVRWFIRERVGGGYESTQANLIVYQALAEYWTRAREQENDLNVKIVLPGRSHPLLYHFNRNNLDMTRTVEYPQINEDIEVTATGTGEATLTAAHKYQERHSFKWLLEADDFAELRVHHFETACIKVLARHAPLLWVSGWQDSNIKFAIVMSLYYALPSEKQSNCQKFNLTVQLLPESVNVDDRIYKMKINILYNHLLHDAGMSVLDIGLAPGFTVNPEEINLLSRGREINKILIESGSLLIHLDKVSHTQPKEITFRITQNQTVDILQPAAVSVYEYHDEKHCVKFYNPERRDGQLHLICKNNDCICAEGGCARQRKDKVEDEVRIRKACESTATNKIDYIYKVRVEEYENGISTDFYKMLILAVIMNNAVDIYPVQRSRIFFSHPSCKELLGLSVGKTYLIMGTSRDIYRVNNSELYEYNLSETTWIEYWPTETDCQTEEHRDTCNGITTLVAVFVVLGCRQ